MEWVEKRTRKGVFTLRKALLVLTLLVAVAVMAAPAVAGGKARGPKKPTGCKAVVAYVVEGTLASVGAGSVTVDVVSANKHAQTFGASMTFAVDAATKVSLDEVAATLADLEAGDEVNVQARACKGADPVVTTLVARHVSATSPVVEEPVVEEAPVV